jgi:phosphoribosylformylglycinamidine cyclo-ligase
MYAEGEYDLAGFCLGVVAKKKIIDGKRVEVGDVAIGLPSSGLHANGFSLARAALKDVKYTDPFEGKTWGQALLEPTRLYANAVQALLRTDADVRAMAHITGGGMPGNVPRVLPEGLGLRITAKWTRPAIFDAIERRGMVEEKEMRRTFNCGIGYVIVVAKRSAENAMSTLASLGESPIRLGEIVSVDPKVEFEDRVEWP